MLFDNILTGLLEIPLFFEFIHRDVNPLGKTKKMRIIEAPNDAMRTVHNRLRCHLRNLNLEMPAATGCIPGTSPRRGLERHRTNTFLYLVDLRDAYHSVRLKTLALILVNEDSNGFGLDPTQVEAFLERYCASKHGGLAVGGPASQDLFNLYAHWTLDLRLQSLAGTCGLTYGRYLDDLLFSSSSPIGKRVRAAIRRIVVESRFEISHHKCHRYDLRKGPAVINGVGLERGGRTFLPGWYRRKIKGLLYQALATREVDLNRIRGYKGLFYSTVMRFDEEHWLFTKAEQKLAKLFRKAMAVTA